MKEIKLYLIVKDVGVGIAPDGSVEAVFEAYEEGSDEPVSVRLNFGDNVEDIEKALKSILLAAKVLKAAKEGIPPP